MAISLTFLFLLYFSAINILCYQNPTQRMFDSPDPGVFRDSDGSFYAVTTGGLNDKIFPMWKSKDMGSWLYVGSILDQAPAWTDGGDFWAPQIHKVNDLYLAYYTARTQAHKLCIGVAFSSNIYGPYTDIGQPLWQQDDLGIIDATFYSDNGKNYLIYKTDGNAVGKPTQIYAIELSPQGTKVIGQRTFLLRNTLQFQQGIIEAPWIIYQNNFYYLFYSSCGYADKCYSVSVARSKTLLGGYEKYNKTILYTREPEDANSLEGPGHCSVVKGVNNNWAIVYHAWPHEAIGTKRLMMLDQVKWTDDKWPFVGSPSEVQMPLP